MASVVNLALRGLEFIWTLLIMAIVGNMIAEAVAGNPSIVNYAMFVAVFSMLSLFYLIPAGLSDSLTIHPVVPIGLDVFNTLFFFCGAVALAAMIGAHSCDDKSYTRNNSITNGAIDQEGRCREAQASTAFLFFGFACYAASAVMSGLSSRGSANVRGANPFLRKP